VINIPESVHVTFLGVFHFISQFDEQIKDIRVANLVIGVVERLHDTLAFSRRIQVVGQGLADAAELVDGLLLLAEYLNMASRAKWLGLTNRGGWDKS
jgi:hypothetical protein